MNDKNFLGLSNFVWWIGVVENRMDPLNMGRLQIRIFGWHTDNLQLIPSGDLPWAPPVRPIDSVDKTPREGEWVMGFFMDGTSGQIPYYLGVFAGIPDTLPNQSRGFADPRTQAQLNTAPRPITGQTRLYPNTLNQPTTSRLYRNEDIANTIISRESAAVVTADTADGVTWTQPTPSYNTAPPYNRVLDTESGHVMEFDDTRGAERVHLAHRTGTYFEIRPDGSKVTKVVGKNYEVVAGDDYVYIQGACTITVNGNAKVYVKQNAVVKVDGNCDTTVGGNYGTTIGGTCKITSGGNMTLVAPRIDLNP